MFTKQLPGSLLKASLFLTFFLVPCGQTNGQFGTIFNVPPDPDPMVIGTDTQLNVFAGGEIGEGFIAGNPNGSSTNVQVNIFGGVVGDFFTAHPNTEINLMGGFVGSDLSADGVVLNISGDVLLGGDNVIPSFVSFLSNSTINIFDDAQVRNLDLENCDLNMWGGSVMGGFDFSGVSPASVKVSNSSVNVFGGDFGTAGFDVSKIRVFEEGYANYFGGNIGVNHVHDGGTINIFDDANVFLVVLRPELPGVEKPTLNMFGGFIDDLSLGNINSPNQSDAVGSQAFLYDGAVDIVRLSPTLDGPKRVVVNGVSVQVRVSSSGSGFDELVQILNGSVECLRSGTSEIFGGSIEKHTGFGDDSLYGSEFQLLDVATGQIIEDVTPNIQFGVPYVLEERDVILRAVLADGTSYQHELKTFAPGIFNPNSLTLHLSQELTPSRFQVIRGTQTGGGLPELASSDDQRLSLQPGFTLNSSEPPVWFTTELNTPVSAPTNLRLMIEANVSTPNLAQIVEVWNWNTGAFEKPIDYDFEANFLTDRLRVYDLTDRISDFVEPGTGNVRTRTGWKADGFVLGFPWTVNVDRITLSTN